MAHIGLYSFLGPFIIGAGACIAQTRPTSFPATAPSEFQITIQKHSHIGDQLSLELVDSECFNGQDGWVGSKNRQYNNVSTWHLIFDSKVLKVANNGEPSEVQFAIKLFTFMNGLSGESQVLPPGTVVIGRSDGGRGKYTVGEKEPDQKTAVWLSRLVPMRGAQLLSNLNEYYGLTLPHRIGESWSIDVPMFLAMYKLTRWNIRPDDISGRVTLVDREKYDGIPCLRLESE